jgi:hypothetical protein
MERFPCPDPNECVSYSARNQNIKFCAGVRGGKARASGRRRQSTCCRRSTLTPMAETRIDVILGVSTVLVLLLLHTVSGKLLGMILIEI